MRFVKILAASLIAGQLGGAVLAADKRDILGSFRDWDALTITRGDGSKECFMISSAKKWRASKSGVRRGDIYITITHRPAFGVEGEISVNVGYPLKPESNVKAQVDSRRQYSLFSEGSAAWAYDSKDDSALVSDMRAGNQLVVQGTSARGTRTTDTYSLSGFTAAYKAISKACAR